MWLLTNKPVAAGSRCSSPCGALSIAERPDFIDVEVGKHKLRNVVPKHQAGLVIEPSVLSREDPAQAGLRRNVVVAGKGPNGTWQNIRGYPDLILVTEEGGQHGRSGRANRAVGAWIRGIRCGDADPRPIPVAALRRLPAALVH